MAEKSDPSLIAGNWFPPDSNTSHTIGQSPWFGLVLGSALALLLMRFHSIVLGCIVLVLSLAIGIASLNSKLFHQRFASLMERFGAFVGQALSIVVLVPVFLLGFTLARIFMRLTGQDPLSLRQKDARTYWIPSDGDSRKRYYSRSMFATDPPASRSRLALLPVVFLGLGLLVGGELLLVFLGYGDAVLYTADPYAGYYPAPNQSVERFGGLVETNSLGMRAPEFKLEKPNGAFRILLIGDSTLYGGQYTDQSELYARLLQDQLQELTQTTKVEVLNMGVNGWGPFNKIGYVEYNGTHDADLCLICMPLVDLTRPLVSFWETPYFRAESPPRAAYEEVFRHLSWRQNYKTTRQELIENRDQNIEKGIVCYLKLAELIQTKNCEVFFQLLPTRTPGTTDTVPSIERDMLDRFSAQLDAANVPYSYPAQLFIDHPMEEVYHDRVHLNPMGHTLYANYLTGQVTEMEIWKSRVLKKSDVPPE